MIIGFVAPKQHGKTTACNIIKKHLDDVVQINFKDALIEEIKRNFPDLLEVIAMSSTSVLVYESDNSKKEVKIDIDWLFQVKPPLMRALMQNYGTNVRRGDDPDYWVNTWQVDARTALFNKHTVLTDDVRFLNEATALKQLRPAILIRLERTDLEQTDTHQSETEQARIECDYTITTAEGEHDKLEAELIKIINETIPTPREVSKE